MSVRLAALTVLLAVERGRTTLGAETDRARRSLADERDRALLVELTAGTLRWQAQLDALLEQCSRRSLAEVDPAIRAIVRLAAYQLEHLDRIPPHAALNEAVELTRTMGHPRAAGFVNAVLRSFKRSRTRLALPPRPDLDGDASVASQVAYLSVSLSHPEWLVTRWLERYGFEAAERWCQFNNRTPDVTIRSCGRLAHDDLLAALRSAGLEATSTSFVGDAIRLPHGSIGRVPHWLADEFLIQDEASQIVAHLVGASPGERVLDVCASPGAKTVVLSADLGGSGRLVASDYRPSRVRLLRRTLASARVHAGLVRLNATRPLPFGPVFDRVLVDAPCSGLGVLRRDPDLKWSCSADDLAGFAETQQLILTRAAEVVRPGGTVLYATCSSEPEENDEVVGRFLDRHQKFSQAPLVPSAGVSQRAAARLVDAAGLLRTLPFRDGLDAFFAAALVRRGPA